MKIDTKSVGITLLGLYIFMSYNALDVILPSSMGSLSLLLFVAFGVFACFVSFKTDTVRIPVYSLWYLIFMVYSLAIMIASPENSVFSGEFYLMIVSFVLTFFFPYFVRSDRSFQILVWIYALSSAVLILTLIFTGNMVADANNRLGGDLMGNANTFASMVMVAVMYTIWLLLYGKNRWFGKLLLFAIILLDYYALILSAGRKFFLIPFIFLYILLLFKADNRGRKHFIRYTVLIVALAALVMYLIMNVPVFYETIGYRIESYINGVAGVDEQGASAAIRERMQQMALEKWFEKPFFGYGFDSFKHYNAGVTGHFFYSHCNFTELLYNGGIVYFLLYYWIFWYIAKQVWILKKGERKYRAFAGGAAICFLIFDYGAVSYSIATIQCMLALSLVMLSKTAEEIPNE